MADSPLGRFCWYDLMTTDPDAAADFYTRTVGWGTQAMEGPRPYTMWTNGETPLGGVMQLPEEVAASGVPPHWLGYLSTPDIEGTVAKIRELGGNVMKEPMQIPGAGTFAVVSDPQGAVFAVYTSEGDTSGHDGPRQVGEFSWHELMTTDYEAAFGFYSAVFGWEKGETMDMGEAGTYQLFVREGVPVGGIFNKPDEAPVACWLYYAKVDDVAGGVERVKEAGGQVMNGPMEVPGGDQIAQCTDPQGGMFALHASGQG